MPNTLKEIVRLRWISVGLQLFTFLSVITFLDARLPIFWIATSLFASCVANVIVPKGPLDDDTKIGILLIFDALILTALLLLSGGPSNPFSVFFLTQVALAAVFAKPVYTWIVVAVTSVGFGLLFFWHIPLPETLGGHSMGHGGSFSVHLQGMWLAYTLTAIVIAVFVSRLSQARQRAEQAQERSAHLLALATLAAGAAHEIGNPLGTIKIAAGELKRTLEEQSASDEILSDINLIDDEIERARAVLKRMSQSAGELMGERPRPTSVQALVDETMTLIGAQSERVRISVADDLPEVQWPLQASAQAFQQLIKNALDASEAAVQLKVKGTNDEITFTLTDQGKGMSRETLMRVGEPFYTTGTGMGLGVFIARSLIQHSGGTMAIESTLNRGTKVLVTLPRSARGQA